MARNRLKVWHLNRQNGITSEREVSPQRLVHYRDNWYLDAGCHLRNDIRSFSVDAISRLEVLDAAAKEVATKNIDHAPGSGYVIFNGAAQAWAKLRFTPDHARWVAGETWHSHAREFSGRRRQLRAVVPQCRWEHRTLDLVVRFTLR